MVLVMAEKVVPMRAQAAVLTYVAGGPVNVTGVCRASGISRKTFYKYVARVRDEGGVDGFTPRSRAPHSCPQRLGVDVEDAIVTLRKRLVDDGLDHGPTTIQWHLGRDPKWRRCVPSVASVYRVLVRRGFVVAEPFKRPKTSWKRFEAPAPNEMWQIDATDWTAIGNALNREIEPQSDLVYSADFKRHLALVALRRAIERALTRGEGTGGRG
jgi:hypothetical protein